MLQPCRVVCVCLSAFLFWCQHLWPKAAISAIFWPKTIPECSSQSHTAILFCESPTLRWHIFRYFHTNSTVYCRTAYIVHCVCRKFQEQFYSKLSYTFTHTVTFLASLCIISLFQGTWVSMWCMYWLLLSARTSTTGRNIRWTPVSGAPHIFQVRNTNIYIHTQTNKKMFP